jgi:hypothetical protein
MKSLGISQEEATAVFEGAKQKAEQRKTEGQQKGKKAA